MTAMPSTRTSRRLIAAGLLLLAALGVVAFLLLRAPGNVSHPNLEFTAPHTTPAPPAPKPAVAAPVDDFLWPRYGFDAARTRYLPNSAGLDPPFRRGWTYRGSALLEFPPVIHHTDMFLVDDSGLAVALDKRTGHVLWSRKVGTLAAASPAVGSGLVFVPLLSTRPNAGQNPGAGRFIALSQQTGRVVWSRDVAAGTESSPLVWGPTVYFGDQSGTVYALRATSGHLLWAYHAAAAVKGGPSLSGGILYFGDYAGRAYAINAATGREVWAVSTSGTKLGFGSGNFYSTPAVAFGRVYMGNTDGRVYSFAAHSGRLAWATSTGAYVYASPAVADIPGLGPTVYIGSYDGTFYAFNARSGAIRWSHAAGGRISGSPTIIGDVVYYSNLGTKTSTGLDVRSGREVFKFPEGAFNPAVADQNAIYLTGYANLFELLPERLQKSPPNAAATTRPPALRPVRARQGKPLRTAKKRK
jgi:outer membrane protein assembly factor BamB